MGWWLMKVSELEHERPLGWHCVKEAVLAVVEDLASSLPHTTLAMWNYVDISFVQIDKKTSNCQSAYQT